MNIDDEPRSGVGLMKADDVLLSTVRSCSSMSPTIRLAEGPPFSAKTYSRKRRQLSNTWARQLDRVNVLGSNDYGHTGCVNALSWARNGELLISSGDDYNIRVWRMDPSPDPDENYPFACQSVINTGHSQNVFNAQMLPHSSRIATVAGDKQVRVFDVGDGVGRSPTGSEMTYTTAQACIRLLRCHSGRTKRIVTEDSPDLFLTVAEDGTVRQHDLRTSHTCAQRGCPAPLVSLSHELSTIALSPLTPYQFVVGGESPFAHLFDRRHIGRYLKEEWGMSPVAHDATTCVRKFSRHSRARGEQRGHEHITGARMSAFNGHEVLLSFSSDAVYLYSTRDEPGNSEKSGQPSILAPNVKHRKRTSTSSKPELSSRSPSPDDESSRVTVHSLATETDDDDDDDEDPTAMDDNEDSEDSDNPNREAEDEDLTIDTNKDDDVPVIYPRMRFTGHSNVETIKDVNFLGPCDEYVTSGSDDGNFFIWDKISGEVVDIFEGDENIVNVIEGHPTLPLIAVSGIDTTVKLFAPSGGPAKFSRLEQAGSIMRRNARAARRRLSTHIQLSHLFAYYERTLQEVRSRDETGTNADATQFTQCANQ